MFLFCMPQSLGDGSYFSNFGVHGDHVGHWIQTETSGLFHSPIYWRSSSECPVKTCHQFIKPGFELPEILKIHKIHTYIKYIKRTHSLDDLGTLFLKLQVVITVELEERKEQWIKMRKRNRNYVTHKKSLN